MNFDFKHFRDVLHAFDALLCRSGVGRTGVFCAFVAAINEVNAGIGIPSVVDILTTIRLKRKYMVQEKVS